MLHSVDRMLYIDQIIVDNLCLYFSLTGLAGRYWLGFVNKVSALLIIVDNVEARWFMLKSLFLGYLGLNSSVEVLVGFIKPRPS
jgi:hypothetical protein